MSSKPKFQMILVSITLCAAFIGCGRPSETQRDNRRLLDAILTAVVIHSPKELAKDKALLEGRLKEGKVSQASYDSINRAISQAEKGEWTAAEKDLYDMRGKLPFPK